MTHYSPLQSIAHHHLLWNSAHTTPHFSPLTTELKELGVQVDLFKFPANWRITGTYSPMKRLVFLSNLFPLCIVTEVLKFCVSCSRFGLLIKGGLSEVSNSLSITPGQVCLGNFLHVHVENQNPYSQANITTAIMGPKFSSRFTSFLVKWKSLWKSIKDANFWNVFSITMTKETVDTNWLLSPCDRFVSTSLTKHRPCGQAFAYPLPIVVHF